MIREYASFSALQDFHSEGRDYLRIRKLRKATDTVVVAPHAGTIEPFTGAIAAEIAGLEFSLYTFTSRVRKRVANLHITSHRFDDPACISLVARCRVVVVIHGCKGAVSRVLVGGRDHQLGGAIAMALRKAGISAITHDHAFPGTNPMNLCNRGRTGKGVQLELTTRLRRSGRKRTAVVEAVRDVLLKRASRAV